MCLLSPRSACSLDSRATVASPVRLPTALIPRTIPPLEGGTEEREREEEREGGREGGTEREREKQREGERGKEKERENIIDTNVWMSDLLVTLRTFCLRVLNLVKLAICLIFAKNCTREY